MTRIHAVVLNYNQHANAVRAMQSLRASAAVEVDVLVVDSGSAPADRDALRQSVPAERLLLLPANVGYAAGMNAGIRWWAQHDADAPVLLVTPDTLVGPDVAQGLHDALAADDAVGAVGPIVVYRREPHRLIGAGGALEPKRARIRLLREVPSQMPYDVDWIEGCCMLLRTRAVREVGGLDESYFLYFEEIDLCRRLTQAGWRVRVAPAVAVDHPKPAGHTPAHFFYYMTRNGYRFWAKNFGVPTSAAALETARSTVWLGVVALASLVLPSRWGEAGGRAREWWLQLRGALAGTRDHLRGLYGPRPAPMQRPE